MTQEGREASPSNLYRRLISLGLPAAPKESSDEAMNELYETRLEANRFGCLVAVIVVSSGFLADYFYYPEQAGTFAAIRIPSLIILAALWFFQGEWNPRRGKFLPITVFMLASAISWIVTLMIWNVKGAESPYFGGFMLVLMGMAFVMRVSPVESLTYGLYMLAQYVFAVWAHGNNLFGFAVDMPADAQASVLDLLGGNSLFAVGFFFITVSVLLCTIGAVLITNESFSRLLEKAKAKRAREDLMGFVAMASHEIKTPVQYLVTCSEHLTNSSVASADPEFAKIRVGIEHQTKRLLNELSKLSEVTRIEDEGKLNGSADETATCSFRAAFAKVIADARIACEIGNIALKIDDRAENIVVPGTSDDLFLIINNVANNAVKFTPSGGVISISAEITPKETLRIIVSDTGPGMSADQVSILFEPFRQGGVKTMSRHFSGMGLGMYLSKNRIEALGGVIEVQSVQGRGTSISMDFPVVERLAESVERSEREEIGGGVVQAAYEKSTLEHFSYENSRGRIDESVDSDGLVLIVDDEASIHESIDLVLKGWKRVHAINADEALRAVSEMQPNVVIMDVMLPGMDGIKAVRRIRSETHSNAMQIIVSSALLGYEAKPLLQAAIDEGANDVINKPFSLVELEQRVRAHMRVSQLTLTLESAYKELKLTQGQLVQSEKLRTISILTDGLLHNIGNPLSSSLSTFTVLKEKYSVDERLEKHWKNGLESLRSVARQINELKKYTHPKGGGVREVVRVESLFNRALDVTGLESAEFEVSRSFEVPDIECNALYTTQILVAFLLNAKDAVRNVDAKSIRLGSKRTVVGGEAKIDVYVSDNGHGISQDQPLFDAYYTDKDIGEGSGLGLYVASIMAREMGAQLVAKNNDGAGAMFAIRFDEQLGD